MAWAPGSRSERGQQPGRGMPSPRTCHQPQVRTALPSCPGPPGPVRSAGSWAFARSWGRTGLS